MTIKSNQCERQRQQQQPFAVLLTIVLFYTSTFLCLTVTEARRLNKRLVIHVPFKVKTHHHTHTVYTLIHTGGTKQTIYKVIGYAGHGHSQGHDYADDKYPQHQHQHQQQQQHQHTHDKYNYDSMQHDSCDSHKGDMVFNHYARNDKYHRRYYPSMATEEEYIEDEQGDDEWGERRSSMGCYGC